MKSLRAVFLSMFCRFGIVMPADLPSSSRLGPPFSFGRMPAYAAAADLIHHVMPKRAAGIRQSAFGGKQQQTRIFERRSRPG